MPTTPTARSLAVLRRENWTAQVCEHWNSFARVRVDFLGVADVAALREGQLLLIQCCAASGAAARVQRLLAAPRVPTLLSVPGVALEVWDWARRGPRGKAKRWQCRRQRIERNAEGVLVATVVPMDGL